MASLINRLADFRYRRKAASRGFVVQETDGLDLLALVFAQPGLNRGGISTDTPVRGNELRNEVDFFGHLFPKRRELAGFHHQYLIAGRKRVDECGLPGAGACSSVNDHRIGSLEDGLDAFETLLRKPSKLRTAMVDNRRVHRPQDAVRERRGARNMQKMAPDSTRGILSHRQSAPERQLLRVFRGSATARPDSRAVLVALNYECNIAVKRFSARQTSHNA